MAKVTRNPVVQGIRGSISGLVFREMPDGRTWVSAKPDFSKRKFSEGQKSHQTRFREASAYAREAAKREPIYAQLAAGTVKSPYNIALSDWFHPPVIHEVTREAGRVRVRASDNVKVARVQVMVLQEDGEIAEQKDAQQINEQWWECSIETEGKLKVAAWDLAHNVTSHE